MNWKQYAALGVSPEAISKAKSDALPQALFNMGSAFSAAGAPSRVPGGRPLNLAPVFQGYQNSLANSMKQALMLKQLERQEEEYTRKKEEREAIKTALTSRPETRHVPTGAQLKVTDLSYQPKTDYRGNNMPTSGPGSMWNKPGYDGYNPSQTVLAPETRAVTEETNPVLKSIPEGLRPILTALGQGGAGKESFGAILAAALKPTTDSSIVKTAKYLYPNDPAAQQAFIVKSQTTPKTTFTNAPVDYLKQARAKSGLEEEGRAQAAAVAAQSTVNLVDDFAQLLTKNNTGLVSEATLPVRQFLFSMGIKDGKVPIQEAMTSIRSKLALSQHQKGMGPMTDSDFRIYASIGPSLGATFKGNRLLIHRLRHEAKGKIAYAQKIREQLNRDGMADPAAAWKQVRKDIGPLIPVFKDINALKNYTITEPTHVWIADIKKMLFVEAK